MKNKTELAKALEKKSIELSTTGNDLTLTVGAGENSKEILVLDPEKLPVYQRAAKDAICIDLILSNRFEIQKYEQTLVKWPEEFGRLRVSSISDCFELPTPSLATVNKYKGEFKTVAMICKLLDEVYQFFNVTNTLSEVQLQMSASLILEGFYFLTIADIRLCFFNAYKNKYGKLYNRLDGSIILDWLKQYSEERAIEAQRISEKKSSEEKSGTFSPDAAENFKKIFDSVKDIARVAPINTHYYDIKQYFKHNKGEGESETYGAISDLYNDLPEGYKAELDFTSFRTWTENKILYRINKKGVLSEILEALKAGKI